MRQLTPIVALLVAVVLVGCGGGGDPAAAVVGSQGVPLPPGSELSGTAASGAEIWSLGLSGGDVSPWFSEALPEGQPLGEWEWCGRRDDGLGIEQYGYLKGSEYLAITVISGVTVPSKDAPAALIGVSGRDEIDRALAPAGCLS